MRKWTMSACVVLALCLPLIMAAIGTRGPDPVAQANTRTATSISITNSGTPLNLASDSVTARPAPVAGGGARLEVTATAPARHPASWTVRPGDTLSGIAAALGVPGGWQALYAANRHAIGPSPNLISVGTVLALPGPGGPAQYAVAPGDTLSGIAAALSVPGGWRTLYAVNRHAVGPNPDLLRPGTVLSAARPAGSHRAHPAARQGTVPPAAPAPVGTQSAPRPLFQAPPAAGGSRSPAHLTAPSHLTVTAGGMPRWLEDVLLAAGVLAATAFAAEPAAAIARRRRAGGPRAVGGPRVGGPRVAGPCTAPGPAPESGPVPGPGAGSRSAPTSRPSLAFLASAAWLASVARPAWRAAASLPPRRARRDVDKARIIRADHERLVVTYCPGDHTVYLLSPPGEDPRVVLDAARLVLSEDTYQDLAGHLGVSAA